MNDCLCARGVLCVRHFNVGFHFAYLAWFAFKAYLRVLCLGFFWCAEDDSQFFYPQSSILSSQPCLFGLVSAVRGSMLLLCGSGMSS